MSFYAVYPGSLSGSGVAYDTGAGPTTVNTLRTVIVTDQTVIPVSISGGALDFGASAAAMRVAALLGNPTGLASFGTGASSAQTLRTVLSSDSSVAVTQTTSPWVVSGSGNFTVVQATAANLNATVTGTVAVSNFPATQPVSGTVTVNQGTSPWVENVSQFGGSNVVTGVGSSGAGIPRVTVSSDSSITNITGTISLPTGAATQTTLAAINTKLVQESFGPAVQAASVSVSIASDQPAIATTPASTALAYTDVGEMAFGALTNAYTSVIVTTAPSKIAFIFNNFDAAIAVSLNGGSSDSFYLAAGDECAIDFGPSGINLPTSTDIQAKYRTGAPTTGSVRVSVVG